MKTFNKVFTIIVLIFLYIPMIVLGAASFNNGTDPAVWQGFTLTNYGELFRDGAAAPAAQLRHRRRHFILLATMLGTMASLSASTPWARA
jgi:spermidine/putrescine transport system permease protein